VIKL
jgi:hypothetical protein